MAFEEQMKFDAYSGWWLPKYEAHLQDWMKRVGDKKHGRLLYQGQKYRLALSKIPANRRRTAIDVGAHVGLWSWQMIMAFNRVIAFEPMPIHRACYEKNMAGIKNVQLWPYALGNGHGKVWLRTRTPNSSGDTGVIPDELLEELGGRVPQNVNDLRTTMATRVIPEDSESPWDKRKPAGSDLDDIKVQLTTLDACLEKVDDVDFIKIDCEGFEKFVVQGGEEVLKRCKPYMIIEQKPETGMEKRYGVGTTDAIEFVKKLGAVQLAAKQGDYVVGWP